MLGCGLRLVLWERVTRGVVCVGELRLKSGIVGEGHIQSGLCGGVGFCCRHGVYGLYVAWPGRKKYVSVMIPLSVSSTLPWE